MIDWFLLLTPLVLLPIALLFIFVGCQVFFPLDEAEGGESTDTTTGDEPVFIDVELEISAGCEAAANALDIVLTTDITTGHFGLTLTTIPPDGLPISTLDLGITLNDEGKVTCTVHITPAEGEVPPPLQVQHDKIKGKLVEPFKLTCPEGFALS